MTIKNRKNVEDMDKDIAKLVERLGDKNLKVEDRAEIEKRLNELVESRINICGPNTDDVKKLSKIVGNFQLMEIEHVLNKSKRYRK